MYNSRFPLHTDLIIRWVVSSMMLDVKDATLTVIDPLGRRYVLPLSRQGQTLSATFTASMQRFRGWYSLKVKFTDSLGMAEETLTERFFLGYNIAREAGGSVLIIGSSESTDLPVRSAVMAIFADGMSDPELGQLQHEATALDLSSPIYLGNDITENRYEFTFVHPCLWVLIPQELRQFRSATDVDAGYMFPFEKAVSIVVNSTVYLAYRSNPMQTGQTLRLEFSE